MRGEIENLLLWYQDLSSHHFLMMCWVLISWSFLSPCMSPTFPDWKHSKTPIWPNIDISLFSCLYHHLWCSVSFIWVNKIKNINKLLSWVTKYDKGPIPRLQFKHCYLLIQNCHDSNLPRILALTSQSCSYLAWWALPPAIKVKDPPPALLGNLWHSCIIVIRCTLSFISI